MNPSRRPAEEGSDSEADDTSRATGSVWLASAERTIFANTNAFWLTISHQKSRMCMYPFFNSLAIPANVE